MYSPLNLFGYWTLNKHYYYYYYYINALRNITIADTSIYRGKKVYHEEERENFLYCTEINIIYHNKLCMHIKNKSHYIKTL